MAFEGQQPVKRIGAVTGADLSAASVQYKFVKYNGTGQQVVLCSGVNDVPCGVLQAPAPTSAVGQPVEVVAVGQTKLQDGGTLTAGCVVATTASGQGQPAVSGQIAAGSCDVIGGGANAYAVVTVNLSAPSIKA